MAKLWSGKKHIKSNHVYFLKGHLEGGPNKKQRLVLILISIKVFWAFQHWCGKLLPVQTFSLPYWHELWLTIQVAKCDKCPYKHGRFLGTFV